MTTADTQRLDLARQYDALRAAVAYALRVWDTRAVPNDLDSMLALLDRFAAAMENLRRVL